MARQRKDTEPDFSDLGRGTYDIPGEGLVVNGKLVTGTDDPNAIAKYHANADKGTDAATDAMAERDAAIVEAISPAPLADEKE